MYKRLKFFDSQREKKSLRQCKVLSYNYFRGFGASIGKI